MKKLRHCLSLTLAISVSALMGSAYAEEADTSEPASDTMEHIVAIGDTSRLEKKSVTVPCGDLNLANEQGARTLYSRLERASEIVCDVRDFRQTKLLANRADGRECYHKALDDAVASVGSDQLSNIHHEKEPAATEMLAAKVE
jgi:UrcA family protein